MNCIFFNYGYPMALGRRFTQKTNKFHRMREYKESRTYYNDGRKGENLIKLKNLYLTIFNLLSNHNKYNTIYLPCPI